MTNKSSGLCQITLMLPVNCLFRVLFNAEQLSITPPPGEKLSRCHCLWSFTLIQSRLPPTNQHVIYVTYWKLRVKYGNKRCVNGCSDSSIVSIVEDPRSASQEAEPPGPRLKLIYRALCNVHYWMDTNIPYQRVYRPA